MLARLSPTFKAAIQALRVTPAMEAGISDHVWSLEEIVALLYIFSLMSWTYEVYFHDGGGDETADEQIFVSSGGETIRFRKADVAARFVLDDFTRYD